MPARRLLPAALALALIAPVSAMSTSAAAAAAAPHTPKGKAPAVKHLPRPTRAGAHTRAHDPHTVLVRFKPGASSLKRDQALRDRGGRTVAALAGTGFVKVHTNGSADELASRLSGDPTVAEVALDYVRKSSATPNDPIFATDQGYLDTVRVPTAWDRSKGSPSQVVAVIDTGVDGQHPDLLGRTVAGWNAITNVGIAAGAASDDNGHGTMVSGIIAANTNNGVGIAGVAWNAEVMPVKVLDKDGNGNDSDVVAGIDWAVSHGAKIINLSLGGDGDSVVLHDAVTNAVTHGAVVVVAAGNSGDDVPQYPAAYPEAVAVGATDTSGALTDFSSYGSWVDVAAPGWGIVSTDIPDGYGDDYNSGDGTSFAAPIVSGVVALMRAQNPALTPAQVLARLRSTARDAGPRGVDPYYGAGIVDATAALGGGWAPDFAQPVAAGSDEPNDVPARATPFTHFAPGTFDYGIWSTLDVEGDVDWYKVASTTTRAVQVRVDAPTYDPNSSHNLDPVLSVYNSDLGVIGTADSTAEGGTETLTFMIGPGTYYVTVRNHNGARGTNSYNLRVNESGAGYFDPAVEVPVATGGTGPVAVGDVTADGLPDVVTGWNYNGSTVSPDQLYVVPRAGDGTWATPQGFQSVDSSLVKSVAVADLDGDGHNDVVAATAAGVQVFSGNAAGTLDPPVIVPGTAGATDVAVADLHLDGRLDLAVCTASDVAVLSRDAQGAWLRTSVWSKGGTEVKVGDLDGDSRPDLAVVGNLNVGVLLNQAGGWAQTALTVPAANSFANAVEVADVNGDGRADLSAVFGGVSSGMAIWKQTDSGGLSSPTIVPVSGYPQSLEAADINGDGRQDFVTMHGYFSLFQQQDDGTFAPENNSSTSFGAGRTVRSVALADVTQDGRRDAVIGTDAGFDVLRNAGGPTPGGERSWVQSTSVPDFAQGVSTSVAPGVTFARDVAPSSVSTSTVSLLDGHTGAPVPATVTYDAATRTATVKPTASLYDNAPYRLAVSGVTDTSGETMATAYSSTFQTVDLAPPAVAFTATGALHAATLTWRAPAVTDLDHYIVRMVSGTTPPASVTSGTGVYSGTGTSVTVPALAQGATYTFAVWAQDRSGKLSPASSRTLVGTTETMSSSVTSLTYGGAMTLSSRLTRGDNGAAIAYAPVQLWWRKGGTTSWKLLTTITSSSTGMVSFTGKPSASMDWMWIYRGSPSLIGSSSAVLRVGVRTAVSAAVSRTSLPLGGTFTISGAVAPSHAGMLVYLQRYVGNGAWTTVASKTLSTSSTYSLVFKPGWRGTFTYRIGKPSDADHLLSFSPSRVVKVY